MIKDRSEAQVMCFLESCPRNPRRHGLLFLTLVSEHKRDEAAHKERKISSL